MDAVWDKNENEQECEKRAEIPFSVAIKMSGGHFDGFLVMPFTILPQNERKESR